jgi:hypothetical protein
MSQRMLVFWAVFALILVAPRWVCGRAANVFFDGKLYAQLELARGQSRWIESELAHADFHTGNRHFDGEWLFGTYAMSAITAVYFGLRACVFLL